MWYLQPARELEADLLRLWPTHSEHGQSSANSTGRGWCCKSSTVTSFPKTSPRPTSPDTRQAKKKKKIYRSVSPTLSLSLSPPHHPVPSIGEWLRAESTQHGPLPSPPTPPASLARPEGGRIDPAAALREFAGGHKKTNGERGLSKPERMPRLRCKEAWNVAVRLYM